MPSENEYKEPCRKCDGHKTYIVEFEYKNKTFHYFEKCGVCRGSGEVDWVTNITGRRNDEWFVNDHPAGSLRLVSSDVAKQWGMKDGSSIYDGNEYVPLNSERGKALYELFHVGIPNIDEENERV